MYEDNKALCEDLFSSRRTLTVQDFMLKNKAEVAYILLDKKGNEINVPSYIIEAFQWIKS